MGNAAKTLGIIFCLVTVLFSIPHLMDYIYGVDSGDGLKAFAKAEHNTALKDWLPFVKLVMATASSFHDTNGHQAKSASQDTAEPVGLHAKAGEQGGATIRVSGGRICSETKEDRMNWGTAIECMADDPSNAENVLRRIDSPVARLDTMLFLHAFRSASS